MVQNKFPILNFLINEMKQLNKLIKESIVLLSSVISYIHYEIQKSAINWFVLLKLRFLLLLFCCCCCCFCLFFLFCFVFVFCLFVRVFVCLFCFVFCWTYWKFKYYIIERAWNYTLFILKLSITTPQTMANRCFKRRHIIKSLLNLHCSDFS